MTIKRESKFVKKNHFFCIYEYTVHITKRILNQDILFFKMITQCKNLIFNESKMIPEYNIVYPPPLAIFFYFFTFFFTRIFFLLYLKKLIDVVIWFLVSFVYCKTFPHLTFYLFVLVSIVYIEMLVV